MISDPIKSFIVTEDQLAAVAEVLLAEIKPGDVVGLCGEMGAGKTTLVRTLLQIMGYDFSRGFSSPTFSIQNEYQLEEMSVFHLDLYRLQSEQALAELDLLVGPGTQAITLIEWADKFNSVSHVLTCRILIQTVAGDPNTRVISFFRDVNTDRDS